MPFTPKLRQYFGFVTTIVLLAAVIGTYYVCHYFGLSYFDSWGSSLGEVGVAGAILIMQTHFVNKISRLITEADLDLAPKTRTYCRNLSVIFFMFFVQCGDLGVHIITTAFQVRDKKDPDIEYD